jgi:hypothetical protein
LGREGERRGHRRKGNEVTMLFVLTFHDQVLKPT